jgi:hypothetical protein
MAGRPEAIHKAFASEHLTIFCEMAPVTPKYSLACPLALPNLLVNQ